MLPIPTPTVRPAGARRLALAQPTNYKNVARRVRAPPQAVPDSDDDGASTPISRRSAALTALAAAVVAVTGSAKAVNHRVPMFADPVPGSRIGAVVKKTDGVAAGAPAVAPAPGPVAPVPMNILAVRSVALSGLAASAVYAAVTGGVQEKKKCVFGVVRAPHVGVSVFVGEDERVRLIAGFGLTSGIYKD